MPSADRGRFGDLMRFAGLGVQFVVWVGLLGSLGWFADSKLDTSPWLLVTACLLGAAGGMWDVVRSVLRDPKLRSPRRPEPDPEPDPERRDDPP
jgi:F0F1-type ATP synthase assembly protein I